MQGGTRLKSFSMCQCRYLARIFSACVVLLWSVRLPLLGAAEMDRAFSQALSRKYALPPELRGKAREICIDRDRIVYVRSEIGVARLWEGQLALDHSYRPLAGKVAKDLTIADGKPYYLFPVEILSNRDAGKFVRPLAEEFQLFAVNSRNEVLLGHGRKVSALQGIGTKSLGELPENLLSLLSDGSTFIAITASGAYDPFSGRSIVAVEGLKTATFHRGNLLRHTCS